MLIKFKFFVQFWLTTLKEGHKSSLKFNGQAGSVIHFSRFLNVIKVPFSHCKIYCLFLGTSNKGDIFGTLTDCRTVL